MAVKRQKIDDMRHAIGLDYKKPYHRHGKTFYKPYRNRFYTYADDSIWNQLHQDGLAERSGADGLDWLGNQLNITIHDEEQ